MKQRIHEKILKHCDLLIDWYESKHKDSYLPFYASFDLRDAGFKLGNVDGNIFPAGFNNICQVDKESAPELVAEFLNTRFPGSKQLLLMTEDHLKNLYYWENVIAIRDVLTEAGYKVDVGMLSDEVEDKIQIQSFSGKSIDVSRIYSEAGQLMIKNTVPDLVLSNNDFSNSYSNIDFSATKMTPLRQLGWYQRKKHVYFENYNRLVKEFSAHIEEDPWFFEVQTQRIDHFEVTDEKSRQDLGEQVQRFIDSIGEKYKEHNIESEPYVFIKNNSGTYGLGVVEAKSGDDVEAWNYKAKKKMKASKGGGGIAEVIIQEGIPSALFEENATAEPVIYMLGSELAGGFLRTHEKKDARQSLNSPGAVYKRLCLSDLKVRAEGCLLENVYGWLAKLGLLAISEEGNQIKI